MKLLWLIGTVPLRRAVATPAHLLEVTAPLAVFCSASPVLFSFLWRFLSNLPVLIDVRPPHLRNLSLPPSSLSRHSSRSLPQDIINYYNYCGSTVSFVAGQLLLFCLAVAREACNEQQTHTERARVPLVLNPPPFFSSRLVVSSVSLFLFFSVAHCSVIVIFFFLFHRGGERRRLLEDSVFYASVEACRKSLF